ncbi:Phosphoglycerate mutase family protein [Rhynchospora pubera]|uniref:Phosphoglycerate mutase family protein n=1 Tax=Rhynchospora pubera TaxID=906938 RepID=A0AAV8GNK5_9POAL|nr:Phosphoglycerate mutase family protein [Rhynchospora pubera]
MEGGIADPAGLALYPSHRCKTLYLIRHGQAVHNVAGEKDHKAYSFPEFFDAQLTPAGWDQVDNLRKHVNACGLAKRIELVVVSPLLRTMQTAAVVVTPSLLRIHHRLLQLSTAASVWACTHENDEDVYWRPDSRETDEQVAARGVTFLKWYWVVFPETSSILVIGIFSLVMFLVNSYLKFSNNAICMLYFSLYCRRIHNSYLYVQ